MAQREVRVGLMTYVREDGLTQFGQHGEMVAVHDDDLERFDRLNGSAPADDVPAKPTRSRK